MKKLISLILAGCLLVIAPMTTLADIKVVGKPYAGDVNIMIDHGITEDSYSEFMEATAHLKNVRINLYIHSNGGDAYSTVGMVNRILDLKDRGCYITTIVQAKAFSAGAYLFIMGDERIVYEGSSLMFHTMMQQASKSRIERARKARQNAVQISMIERMDSFIEDRFREAVGDRMSEKTIQYYLYGSEKGDINGQFMSAKTAFNTGVATEFISANR